MDVSAKMLVSAVRDLAAARDLDSVMSIVKHTAREIVAADGVTFVLRDENRCYYVDEEAIAPLWKGQKFPMEICISGWVMNHRQQVAIEDIYQDSRIPHEAYRPTFVSSLAMTPIRSQEPIGAIGAYWAKKYRPTSTQLELLQALADSASVAMENVGLYSSLQKKVDDLEFSERRHALATDVADVGTWEWDMTNDHVTWSGTGLRMFGFNSAEDGSSLKAVYQRIHQDDLKKAQDAIGNAIDLNGRYNAEYRIILPSGEFKWIRALGQALYENGASGEQKPVRLLGVVIDVTESKNADIELRRAKEEAESANKMKSAFLANMSHEIRTPLGAVLGFAELLREPDLSTSERESYHGIIERNGAQLQAIINDILDIARVESGTLRIESAPFDIEKEILEGVSLIRAKAANRGLTIETSINPLGGSFIADPTRFRQIIFNVLGNAVKFTTAGHIRIEARIAGASPRGREIHIDVSDTGIGIEPEHIARLFKPFTQADESMTRQYGGTGLGLSLSKRLAELMGGDLVLVKSAPMRGSTFRIIMREHNAELSAVGPSATQAVSLPGAKGENALHGMRILAIEDVLDIQHLILSVLSKSGATVMLASNGMEGVDRALSGNFDLVLMDIQMPVLDGYSATQTLRERGFTKPIIALTAHAMKETEDKCKAAGCTDFLAKPLTREGLLAKVLLHQPKPA